MKINLEVILNKLSQKEQEEARKRNIDTLEKLLPLLLKRVSTENLAELLELLKQSILPSICIEKDSDIEELFEKLDRTPELLFDKTIQKILQEFIEKRFERDKKIVIQRTSDIYKFVTLMGQYLNDAITSSGSGTQNVLNIKEKIQTMDLSNDGLKELSILQKELVNAASLIEDEMNTVSEKLKSGKSKVEELEEKVKTLEQELSESKKESMIDHLTGVLTRRAYDEEMKRIESSFQRYQTQYALIFFDLDFFKKINDNFGHDCGDVVLSTFGKILNKNTRDHDIVGRYGGEEFVAIVHYTLNSELLQYLNRIKNIVTQNAFVYKQKKIKVTFSAGVVIRANHTNYESTIQKADMLLYEAKDNGRNQIRLEDGTVI